MAVVSSSVRVMCLRCCLKMLIGRGLGHVMTVSCLWVMVFVAPAMNGERVLVGCDCFPTSLVSPCLWCSVRVLRLVVVV